MTNADMLEKGRGRASQTVCGGRPREARTVGGALGLLEVQPKLARLFGYNHALVTIPSSMISPSLCVLGLSAFENAFVVDSFRRKSELEPMYFSVLLKHVCFSVE